MTTDIITIIFSLLAIVISIVSFVETYIWEKKKESIQAYIDLQEYLYYLYEYQKGEIEEYIDDFDTKEYKTLSNVLARLEMFSIGVLKGAYKRDVIYDLTHGYIDVTLREKIEFLLDYKLEKGEKEFYPNSRKLLQWMDEKTKVQKV